MQLWGGVECTVSRVGEHWRDQTRLSGHHDRPEDIARFAEIGIRALRFPIVWERVAPDAPELRDWRWTDRFLAELRAHRVRPIAGLIHHGSGPHYTSLISDSFVPLFAGHAAAAAERYPWIDDWTPVNEPLTTARFSALYGHWYPHARDERLFWRALLNQIDATRAAMAAIRRVNPKARLIQTEDLGETWSTPALESVAWHYNQRRWLSWDLLTGRVGRDHAMWQWAVDCGFEDRLRAILDDPCPPDIIGVNHYVTSNRFLDDRPEHHRDPLPPSGYHDVCAARVLDPPPVGAGDLLAQAWARYGIPLAVTESHLGCTRDEQLRWLWQGWRACERLVAEGVDIRGFTAWALLGSVDWNSLLTVPAGHYEPGPFELRDGAPQATELVELLRAFGGDPAAMAAAQRNLSLRTPGWWERPERLEYPAYTWLPGAQAA